MKKIPFEKALPIWPKDKEKEMNLTVGFRTIVKKNNQDNVLLNIAASTVYRCTVNGVFVGHGPARGPHDYYRVDCWDLTNYLTEELNVISIEVNGANINSYYVLDQASFLQAEVVVGNDIVAATSPWKSDFESFILQDRLQKVQRYSCQRTFIEYYRLNSNFKLWQKDPNYQMKLTECVATKPKKLIPRGVSYPDFNVVKPKFLSEGKIKKECKNTYWKPDSLIDINPITLKGYPESEVEIVVSDELQELNFIRKEKQKKLNDSEVRSLLMNEYQIFDFDIIRTGFIQAKLTCKKKTKLYILFDEVLTDEGYIDFTRAHCINAIGYELAPGEYDLESFEPYTFKYLKIVVLDGSCEIKDVGIREYKNSDTKQATFHCDVQPLNQIFQAAVETFNQNVTDIYMDCPSRERAGWLCDSFFTSRVEYWLTGKTRVEDNFIENFMLPQTFPGLEEGLIPMCYPADLDWMPLGNIPNWGFWFVLELEEYAKRNRQSPLLKEIKDRIYQFLNYFKKYENEDGLLESVEGWVFVEWSKANELTQDVNYPINMAYAGALTAAGQLYQDQKLLNKANAIRKVIKEQSFRDGFFHDHAIRENGILKLSSEITEVCQYYAFFFNIATPENEKALWETLIKDFGPSRNIETTYPNIHPANAFIGNYLRLELLSRHGEVKCLAQEIEQYFYYMAEKTGTLWEHIRAESSLNHGFASHVIHWLYKDVLGINQIDFQNHTIDITISDLNMNSCEGALPKHNGELIRFGWRKSGKNIVYHISNVDGFEVNISYPKQLNLVKGG